MTAAMVLCCVFSAAWFVLGLKSEGTLRDGNFTRSTIWTAAAVVVVAFA